MWTQLAKDKSSETYATVVGPFPNGIDLLYVGTPDGGVVQLWGWIPGSPVVTPTTKWNDLNSAGWISASVNFVGLFHFPPCMFPRVEIICTAMGGLADYSLYVNGKVAWDKPRAT